MATRTLYPTIAPSLDLNFAGSKTLDPRITFSRASAATYYDGKTVAKAEENLFVYSQDFSNSNWGKFGVGTGVPPTITPDYATAPDGTTTADRAILSLGGGTTTNDISHIVQTLALSGTYTMSVWLKSTDGTSTYTLQLSGASTVTTIEVTGIWQRFVVTGTYNGSYSNQIRLRGGNTPVNSSSCDILIWGAQLEQRSQVTAYTPTTTQPITNYIPVLQTAPAGVPRFDHNPVTGESLGLLVEEQRTNLLNWSEQFDHAIWGKSALVLQPNVSVAPDGTLSAEKVSADTTNANHLISRHYASSSGTYTASIYVKSAGVSRLRLYLNDAVTGDSYVTVDLASESIVASGANGSWTSGSSSLTKLSSGWFRISVSGTQGAGTQVAMILILQSNAGQSPFSGDGYSGIYIWGAQLEAGTFPTSYIKTEASQVTRAADSAQMTGANFSSWYRPDEGTLFADYKSTPTGGSQALFQIDDTTLNNRLLIVHSMYAATPATPGMLVSTPNVTQALLTYPALGTSSQNKIAGAYKTNDFSASFNSGVAVTDNSGYLPLTTRALIGAGIGGSYLNGTIKRIAYYPKRLTDAQLQALTA